MKKLLLLPITLLSYVSGLSAQETGKSELQFSVGLNAREYELLHFPQNLWSLFTTEPFLIPLNGANAIFTSYRRHLNSRFAIGASLGVASNSRDHEEFDAFKLKSTFIIGLDFQFTYLRRPKLAIYSKSGMGVIRTRARKDGQPDYSRTTPVALHLCPVGIRYGKSFGVSLEAGYGYHGIVSLGVSKRL